MEKLYSMNANLQMGLSLVAPVIFGFLYDYNYKYMIMIGSVFLCIAIITCMDKGVEGDLYERKHKITKKANKEEW